MSFGQPLFLWVFLLVPITFLFLRWAHHKRQAAILRLGNAGLIQQLSSSVNQRGRSWQRWLWLLALSLIILAMARPQWGSQVQVVEQEGVQVMVALDISKSMLAADLKPDRLTRAKFEISDLMSRLKGDEIGLALFSGASFIQFPLTSDYDTARAFLENANPNMISRPGTAIGAAIRTAMSGFDDHRSNQKVIVLMTDGEDQEADAESAAKEAAQQGVILYAIGFGSPAGEPIPEVDSQGKLLGYKKDAAGNPILSKLNEVALQKLALATHGRYFRASAGGEELDQLAAELDQLQKAQLESRFTRQKIERYQIFLLLAILALFAHEFIPDRVRQSVVGKGRWWQALPKPVNLFLLIITLGLAGCSESAGKMVAHGNDAYMQQDYATASVAYQSAQKLDDKVAEPIYNLANTYYRQGVYTTSQTLLPQALNLANENLAQSGYYNLGNAHYQSQQWEQAAEAYKEALRRNPSDQDAKHNLELALQHLQSQQQQQQDQSKNDQSQQDQSKQDQQDQSKQDQSKQDQPKNDQSQQDQSKQDQSKQDSSKQDQQQSGGEKDDQKAQQANQADAQKGQLLNEEQARQLLNSVGQQTQTLQERLQEVYQVDGAPPEKDW